ncbi:MAG: biotin/lipoate A/B protein ligase family protein [Planctomycetota bacterium]
MVAHLPFCHLIVESSPASGEFNMAMDAALLSLALQRSESIVRIYSWNAPTVTLGYFQAATASHHQQNPFPKLPVVRRLSGGGAILHQHECTYSDILPPCHPARHNPSELYRTVHQALIRLLIGCHVPCGLRGASLPDSSAVTADKSEHFLCFLRGNANDIVHQSGHKLVGSAQRRRLGAILQHGSVLLQASDHTPNLPGLLDLNPQFDAERFQAELPETISAAISSQWQRRTWTDEELSLAACIRNQDSTISVSDQ